jgi:nitrite reductase/ring-hydroxylating ferredoxin subunit
MTPVAVYTRTIRASLDRIWENVLDWEHLPWLHRTSFVAVELIERNRDGFRVWLSMPPRENPRRALVETELHRDELHYWTRTLEGPGAGSSIRTSLSPAGEQGTDIRVEFFVPDLPAEKEEKARALYLRLYGQLWDEDEAMMQRRQEFLDRAAAKAPAAGRTPLGPLAELRRRVPLVVGTNGRAVRLVEVDGEVVPHLTTCPHLGGPLETAEICEGIVTCPWHGYRFDVRSGQSADGRALRLPPPPRLETDAAGHAFLVW